LRPATFNEIKGIFRHPHPSRQLSLGEIAALPVDTYALAYR
jgi:hypothetical protein